ncbi:MAG: hypothetical protein ABR577_03415 [Pyrinomonadaceae bacterium]
MIRQADISVFSPDDKLQLIVEVKNKQGASPDWAANMRRNLFVHSVVPTTPFFLLALPDRFYLWKNANPVEVVPPDYEIDPRPILRAYTDTHEHYLDKLSGYGLELIINSWLNDLLNTNLTGETAEPYEKWLFDSGLYDAIQHGSVRTEATV